MRYFYTIFAILLCNSGAEDPFYSGSMSLSSLDIRS